MGELTRRRTRLAPEPAEKEFKGLAFIVMNILTRITQQDWRGAEHIPATGGCLVVGNHLSDSDPATLGHFLIAECGRWPRFLGKAELWKVPLIGWLARTCGQIPVQRNSAKARDVVGAASKAIADGKLVVVYPEGGVTRDPNHWPMVPRTGAARIALATRAPLIPLAQWGPQDLMPLKKFPRPFPKKTIYVNVGAPIDLSDYYDREIDHELLDEVSELIMARITQLLVEIRGGTPPKRRYAWTPRNATPKVEPTEPLDAH